MGRVVLFLAWTALVLPWERCHSDCHDRVLPTVATHPCHEDVCCDDATPEPSDDTHHQADHERVDFFSLKPKVELPLFVAPMAELLVEVSGHTESATPHQRVAPVSPVPRTVVLLL